jgi:hypothetical protein
MITGGRLIAVAALAAAASLGFSTVFAGSRHLPALLGAAVLPCVTAGLVGTVTSRPWPRIAAGVAALVSFVALAVAPGLAIRDGVMRLLTVSLPADPSGPELGAAAALVGLAAIAGVELALRLRPALPAALPVLACFVVALGVGASGRRVPTWLPPLLVVGIGALLAAAAAAGGSRSVLEQDGDGGPRLAGTRAHGRPRYARRALAAATMIAVAAALAATLGPALPGATARARRFDARELVAQPVTPQTSLSPLIRFAALRAGPQDPLVIVRTGPAATRLRMVALDTFNGHLWSTGGGYRRAGRTLAAPPESGAPLERVHQTVQVRRPEALDWIPTIGRAVEISVPGLGLEAGGGNLVVPAGQPTPSAYASVGVVPRLRPTDLREGIVGQRQKALPADLPPELQETAQRAAGTAPTAFGQLANLQAFFTGSDFVEDPRADAPSGHGLYQIDRLLRQRRGTAEQFASAFAVLTQILGYDARVVMGFKLGARRGDRYRVVGRQVHAWPEVRFERLGWVPFEPTPTRRGVADPAPADDPVGVVTAAVNGEVTRTQLPHSPSVVEPPPPRSRGASPWRPVAAAAAATVATLAAATVLLPVVKAVRRGRRRRVRDPGRRLLGAWREALDRITEEGMSRTPAMTSGELVSTSHTRWAPDRLVGLGELARLVDAARFAPEAADHRHAAAAWACYQCLCRALRTGRPLHHRLRTTLDPRPLLRRG